MNRFRHAILLLPLAVSFAHADGPFRTVLSVPSTPSFSISAKTVLVNTPEEFSQAWSLTGSRRTPPEVDLQHHSVIFYFAGMRSTTGYSLAVDGVAHRGGVLELGLIETIPGHLCGTGQTATFPLIIVETTPWNRDVDVRVTQVPHDCAP